jgi:hypothetical protein
VQTGLRNTGIAAAGLLAAGIFAVPAYASSSGPVPSDCSVSTSGYVWSMTCTQRPSTQVWNMQVACWSWVFHNYLQLQGSEVTGNGTSTVSNCYNSNAYVDAFVIDS